MRAHEQNLNFDLIILLIENFFVFFSINLFVSIFFL